MKASSCHAAMIRLLGTSVPPMNSRLRYSIASGCIGQTRTNVASWYAWATSGSLSSAHALMLDTSQRKPTTPVKSIAANCSFAGVREPGVNSQRQRKLSACTLSCRAVHTLGGSTGDTIFALSTPPGRGGLAVVRISGAKASAVVMAMMKKAETTKSTMPTPRVVALRELRHPLKGELLDKGMVVWFPGPASFTGEDVIELHLHGSVAVTQAVLSAVGQLDGVRVAQPGEFTRRALLNGKMDLVEAEGLADLLSANTEMQRQVALRQLGGEASRLYERWRTVLVRCLAHTEAFIDFGEDEEIPEEALRTALEDARAISREIQTHCDDSRCGEVLREGVRIVLAGPPNAGKSSLLNALARRPAAITNSRPGTTRDLLEVSLDLSGLPVIVSDTAGLRHEGADEIEEEGMRRAVAAWRSADVRVLVLDSAGGIAQVQQVREVIERQGGGGEGGNDSSEVVVILNKCDLVGGEVSAGGTDQVQDGMVIGQNTGQNIGQISKSDGAEDMNKASRTHEASHTHTHTRTHEMLRHDAEQWLGARAHVHMASCATGAGVDRIVASLHAAATKRLFVGNVLSSSVIITRQRHRKHLVQCAHALDRFCAVRGSPDVLAEELRDAVAQLGAVTGRVHVEQVLDVLFADFCIGK